MGVIYLNGVAYGGSDEASLAAILDDIAEEYDSSATYAVGDYCLRNAVLYRCNTAISVAEEWTAGHWTAVSISDELKGKINASQKGVANGVASLDGAGKVPAAQLPSYIDNVVEGYYYNGAFYEDQAHTQLITGETGKIYVDLSTEQTYRWSGSIYVKISSTLELGETSTTAYRGDRGKTAYDHSQLTEGNPHNVTKANVGLGSVDNTADLDKPVSTATQTALNAKANDSDVQAGTEAKKAYHMGFYLDADGDLCQA
jgi:hypothetical protein